MSISHSKSQGLTGKLLVSSPHIREGIFEKAVVFVCGHDDKGAMGIVINKVADSIDFQDLRSQLNLGGIETLNATPQVHFGGPVEIAHGFVLHSTDYEDENTAHIGEKISLTSNIQLLRKIASGQGPAKSLIALGYAGWSGGQLETELKNNGWLELSYRESLIFEEDRRTLWTKALKQLGIHSSYAFSPQAGNA